MHLHIRFPICDVFDVCNFYNVNFGIVSLDQEKAFDSHFNLFSMLRAFGIGDVFWPGWVYGKKGEVSCCLSQNISSCRAKSSLSNMC